MFNGQFAPGPILGTVNGKDEMIATNFVYATNCAVCDTILLSFDSQTLFLDLPPLLDITYPALNTETVAFIQGSYTAASEFPRPGPVYTVDITPAAMATTPEPPSGLLLSTAAILMMFLHALRSRAGEPRN